MVLLLVSCSKENVVNSDEFSNDQSVNTDLKTGWGLNWHLVLDFPEWGDVECYKPAYNCFDEIVIVGVVNLENCTSKADTIYYYFSYFYDNDSISYFFDSYDWDEIFPGLRSSLVDSIADGHYYLTMRESSEDSDRKIYMLLESSVSEENYDDDDVIYALPIEVQ